MALKHVSLIVQKGKEGYLFPVGEFYLSKILDLKHYTRVYIFIMLLIHARPIICTFNCIVCLAYPHMAIVIMVF